MSAQPLSPLATGPPVRTPPFTPRRAATSDPDRPTVVEMVEESAVFLDFVAVGAPTLPGFLLTVPGLALFVLPVVAIGLLAAVAGLVVVLAAVPVFVAWRVTRRGSHALAALGARALTAARHHQPPRPEIARRVTTP